MSYHIKALELSNILKTLKFGKYLDIGLYENHIKITNLDNKGFTGMVNLLYPSINQEYRSNHYLNIDHMTLCKALDRYGSQLIQVQPDPSQDCLNLSSENSTKRYKVPCSFNTKSRDLVELNPLQGQESPEAQVKINPLGLQELLKDLQAVDTKVQLRIIRDDARSTLILDSSGTDSLFTQRVTTQNSTVQSIITRNNDLLQRKLVVPVALGGLIKLMDQSISIFFYEQYLTIESKTPNYIINVIIPFED